MKLDWIKFIIELVIKYRVWGIISILIGIILYLLRVSLDEDLNARWRSRFYKAVYKISGKSEAEKKYIENDISSSINLARRKMPFGKEHLPKAIKVEWFEGVEGETAHIKENEIVVRLDPSELQEKNIILLANALVKQTSLIGIRYILKEPLEISMDLNLVKNLLKEIGNRRILDWFFRNEYHPNINKSDEIREWNGKIVEIDERGLFTRLLLVELDEYSKRILGKPPFLVKFFEIAGLVDFLYKIATKAMGQDVPLTYIKRHIKIGVIIVGETSKILIEGVDPYLMAFTLHMKRQLTSIYIIQFDKALLGHRDPQAYREFKKLTQELDERIQEKFKINKDFELSYKCRDLLGNTRKAKIFHYIPVYVS